MALNNKWYTGLPSQSDDNRKARETLIRNSIECLDVLTIIIQQEISRLEMPSETDYSNPSWGYLRADRDGQLRVLRQMLALTRLTRE